MGVGVLLTPVWAHAKACESVVEPDPGRDAVWKWVAAQPDDGRADGHGLGVVGLMSRLCRAAVLVIPAAGVGVSVLDGGSFSGVVAASDEDSRSLEELQFTLGEGPCRDVHATGLPVLEPELVPALAGRWPGYAVQAYERGVRAVFAVPVQAGARRLGVLDFYRRRAGRLEPEGLARAQSFAEVAADILVDGQGRSGPGTLDDGLDDALAYRYVVYQAQGMVMVDLGVTLDEALARLRAHAFAQERAIADVATDIVAGRLRLDADPRPGGRPAGPAGPAAGSQGARGDDEDGRQ